MNVRFTDGALDHFAEHARSADVETTWGRLVASLERAARAVAAIGICRYVVIADGLEYVVSHGVVVSVRTPRRR